MLLDGLEFNLIFDICQKIHLESKIKDCILRRPTDEEKILELVEWMKTIEEEDIDTIVNNLEESNYWFTAGLLKGPGQWLHILK